MFFHVFPHVYSPGQGQTNPWGQNFNINRILLCNRVVIGPEDVYSVAWVVDIDGSFIVAAVEIVEVSKMNELAWRHHFHVHSIQHATSLFLRVSLPL